jgi:hypothetical protein
MKTLISRNKFSITAAARCLLAAVALMSMSSTGQATDLLVIKKILCTKSAGGIDAGSTAGFAALGAIVAGGATAAAGGTVVVGTGGAAIGTVPVTALAVAKAAAGGATTAVTALKLLDSTFSGQDDLIVKVNGKTVLPTSGAFLPVNPGDTIDTDIRVSIEQGASIQLIEYDSGSDNDDLGSIIVHHDAFDQAMPGQNYTVNEAIVLAPREEDGSVYYVTYSVLRNAGTPADVTDYMLCGTNQCDACVNDNCVGQSYSQLDRDGDLPDLKSCPPFLVTTSYQKFPQFIVDDVYLRVCGPTCPIMTKPIQVRREIQFDGSSLFRWPPVVNAQLYEIFILDEADNVLFQEFTYNHNTTYRPATALPPGGTYRFSVRGANLSSCESPWSDPLSVTIAPLPVPVSVELVSTDVQGIGSGTVDVSPDPVSQVGGNYYVPGDVVTLSVKPTDRAEFVRWSGDAASCGTSRVCDITVTDGAGMVLKPVFRPKPSLVVYPRGGGTVDVSLAGVACSNVSYMCLIYSTGDAVTMTPVSGPFSAFDHWEGDDDCLDGSVTISDSLTCTAVFKNTSYALTVDPSERSVVTNEGVTVIDCGTDCEERYPVSAGEQTVVLRAAISADSVFVRWDGSYDCWDEEEADDNPLRIQLTVGATDVNCSVVSVAAGTEYALTVEKFGGGVVKAEAVSGADSSGINCLLDACSQKYAVNDKVQLTATATRGSTFAGFDTQKGSNTFTGDVFENVCYDGQVEMTENVTCIARFNSSALVIDGSNSDEPKENNSYISVLRQMEFLDYRIWSVKSPDSTSNNFDPVTLQRRAEPIASDLAPYGRVIWYTGDATETEQFSPVAGPSPAAEAALGEYLDGGGCLLLSSSQYFADRGLTSFAQTYLGVSAMTDNVGETDITGTSDLSIGFSNLGPLGLRPSDAGLTPLLSDAIVHNPEVQGGGVLFHYANGDEAAVGVDNGQYRTAFFGFPFLALGSGNNRINVMGAFMDYCGQAEPEQDDLLEINDGFDAATERQGAVSLRDLRILPGNDDYFRWVSDWYADTRFSISFTHASGDLAIEVYDSTHTLIATAQSGDDNEEIVISNVDAGQAYFVRVFGPNDASNKYVLNISAAGPPDRDHDGVADADDALPEDPSEQFDADNDRIGDNLDLDDDNDGMPDAFEILHILNPLLAQDASEDTDGDGLTNREEFFSGTDPRDSNSAPAPIVPPVVAAVVDLSGTVKTPDSTDVCAMVLASGKFMFSCNPTGMLSLTGLPFEQNGTVKRQIYADGFFPKIDILTGSSSDAVVMTRSGTCPSYNAPYNPAVVPGSAGKRINISGKVLLQDNSTPICAIVLANGKHMFSCDGTGNYALNIPLDSNGRFKLQVYADGFAPTIQTFDEFKAANDVRMARAAECQ